MATTSVSDSECIMAAKAVEKLDRELDELQKVLDDWTQSTATQTEANQPSYIDALAAWLQGFKPEPEPSNWSKTPANFRNLLEKPLEPINQSQIDNLDESTMTASDLDALRPSFVSWPSTSTAATTSTSTSSGFTTPERPPAEHTTCAPKKKKTPSNFANLLFKPIAQSWLDERAKNEFDFLAAQEQMGGANSASPITISSDGSTAIMKFKRPSPKNDRLVGRKARRYSRWSLSRLQGEFMNRFNPLSQKHFNNVELMARALHEDDMEQARKSSMASTASMASSSMISQPSIKKQRNK
jgi:hypothetical protein